MLLFAIFMSAALGSHPTARKPRASGTPALRASLRQSGNVRVMSFFGTTSRPKLRNTGAPWGPRPQPSVRYTPFGLSAQPPQHAKTARAGGLGSSRA